MKEIYLKPNIKLMEVVAGTDFLIVSLDPTKSIQDVTPDETETFEGEFGARQTSIWDEQ